MEREAGRGSRRFPDLSGAIGQDKPGRSERENQDGIRSRRRRSGGQLCSAPVTDPLLRFYPPVNSDRVRTASIDGVERIFDGFVPMSSTSQPDDLCSASRAKARSSERVNLPSASRGKWIRKRSTKMAIWKKISVTYAYPRKIVLISLRTEHIGTEGTI